MTIGEEAKALFEKNEPKGSFAAALLRCFLYGVLVKRPDFILMAEAVFTDGKAVLAVLPKCSPNCWWIWYAAATPKGTTTPDTFMAEAPYPLPYVGFKRKGKIKIHSWDHIRKDIYGRRRIRFSTTTT